MATTVETSALTDAPQNGENPQGSGSSMPSPDNLKRKASPERSTQDDDGASKRPRRESTTQASDAAADQERKRPSAQDEKKRNKRLFGGLLNTLSQSSASNPAQKRRLEIERRQQERMQKQREEDEKIRKERGDRLKAERSRNGIIWEEEVMKNRHKRMLASARFLKTKARPAVYYLPSKRSNEQDDIIEDQIQRAKKLIEREEDDFEERRRQHEEEHGPPRVRDRRPPRRNDAEDEATQGAKLFFPPHGKPSVPDTKQAGNAKTSIEEKRPPSPKPAAKETHGDHDESGDEVVDAEEDMVIY